MLTALDRWAKCVGSFTTSSSSSNCRQRKVIWFGWCSLNSSWWRFSVGVFIPKEVCAARWHRLEAEIAVKRAGRGMERQGWASGQLGADKLEWFPWFLFSDIRSDAFLYCMATKQLNVVELEHLIILIDYPIEGNSPKWALAAFMGLQVAFVFLPSGPSIPLVKTNNCSWFVAITLQFRSLHLQ